MKLSGRFLASLRDTFITDDSDPDDERKRPVIGIVLIVGAALIAILSLVDFLNGETLEGTIELVTVLFLGFGAIRLARGGNIGRLLMAVFSFLLIYAAVTGGETGSKLLWIFILPHILEFILGARDGTIWNLGILVLLTSIFLVGPEWAYSYTPSSILRFALTYSVLVLIALILESVRSDYHRRMIREHERLSTAMKEVETLSITDALTGVYNRGFMDRRLPEECSRAKRYRSGLSIVICDIDLFKGVNDQFGHQVGDQVLKTICTIIGESLRQEVDWIARYGGEEFLIVLPETSKEGAIIVSERLRQGIEMHEFRAGNETIPLTASFGVASFHENGSKELDHEGLIKQADRFLYQAKETGRNRVVG